MTSYDELREKLFCNGIISVVEKTDAYEKSGKAQAMVEKVKKDPSVLRNKGGLKGWTEQFIIPAVDSSTNKAPVEKIVTEVCAGFGLGDVSFTGEQLQSLQKVVDLFLQIYKEEEPKKYVSFFEK